LLELGAISAVAAGIPLQKAFAESSLNLGFQTTTWGAVGMVAENLKTFEKFKAPVAAHQFASGVAVRDALVANRVDIGVTSVSTFLVGVDKGQLTAIAAVAYSGASNSIMVAKKSSIKTVSDLKGKRSLASLVPARIIRSERKFCRNSTCSRMISS
jgi:ABC-type nitrate/sulfonate/bicarbonate transport system substrate-binding protein